MTEIFSYTACRQVLQLFLAIIFFHVSEYFLAIFFHGRSNVTLRNTGGSATLDLQYFNGGSHTEDGIITAGYCGFFIWSIGTQIMMCNPISTVTFAVVVWSFFARRIPYEEYFLRQFFGSEYDEYARRGKELKNWSLQMPPKELKNWSLQMHNWNTENDQSSSPSGLEHSTFFPLFALEMHKQRRYLELVDQRLEGQVTSEVEVEKLVHVALCCVPRPSAKAEHG
ncbi:hypothetical protein C3L33_15243, partial [Rhododendron williamsianum]